MDVSQHLSIIWRRKWVILALSLVVAALAFAYESQRTKVYQADAMIRLAPARSANSSSADEAMTAFLTESYASLAMTRPVTSAADRLSGLDLGVDEADRRLEVTGENAGFITVKATGPSPRAAVRLARAEVDALLQAVRDQQERDLRQDVAPISDEVDALEARLADLPAASTQRGALEARYNALISTMTQRQLEPVDRLQIVGDARAEDAPVAPQPKRLALLAFILAFVVNAELFVLLEQRGDRFSQQDLDEELTAVTGLNILSHIPEGHDELVDEAFNDLRTNLLFMDVTKRLRTVAIVSVDPSAGKSFTAIGIARAVGKLDVPTLLVDADLRRPVLHERLGLRRLPGLTEVLLGHPLGDAVQTVDENCDVVAAGAPAADPAALLGGDQLARLFQATPAAMIVIDTPAAGVFADAASIASQCDVTILVVDPAVSKRRGVRTTMQRLRQVNANVIGVVVNRAKPNTQALEYARQGGEGVGARKR